MVTCQVAPQQPLLLLLRQPLLLMQPPLLRGQLLQQQRQPLLLIHLQSRCLMIVLRWFGHALLFIVFIISACMWYTRALCIAGFHACVMERAWPLLCCDVQYSDSSSVKRSFACPLALSNEP
jgi:hypothetical protein